MKKFLSLITFTLIVFSAQAQFEINSNGSAYLPTGKSYWIQSPAATGDSGPRLRLHHNGTNAYFDYYNTLNFRSGSTSTATKMWLNSDGGLGLGGNAPANGKFYVYGNTSLANIYSNVNHSFTYGYNALFKSDEGSTKCLAVWQNNTENFFVFANGNVLARNYYNLSDERLKSNITDIESPLEKLQSIRGVEFNFNAEKAGKFGLKKGRQCGVLAQEIQAIQPDAVMETEDGYLAVDYSKLVPLLIESIKELKGEVDDLEFQVNGNSNSSNNSSANSSNNLGNGLNELGQNAPNPFSTTTTIMLKVDPDATDATVYVYNMNGQQVKSYTIADRGFTSLEISGSELVSGMYMYTLIVDGVEIATKKMILTDN